MNNNIDIVVTYVNDDEHWRNNFNKWKEKEIKAGTINPNSIQAFGEERLRNWGFTKYWFRAVEKNCPWVHKVFFVIQDKQQIPEWLNTEYKKLHLIYHEDFIPKDLLPVFSGITVGLYINQIKDLSDNYIMCDDDYFFLNPIEETKFFINNIAQHEDNQVPFGYFYDGDEFLHILNNNFDLEKKYTKNNIKYNFYHLPTARKKNFEQKILKENYDYIFNCQKNSKFRYKTNLDANIYPNILKLTGNADILPPKSIYGKSLYIPLREGYDFHACQDLEMVCFNDTNLITKDSFSKVKKDLINFLEEKFPNKSHFEKEV